MVIAGTAADLYQHASFLLHAAPGALEIVGVPLFTGARVGSVRLEGRSAQLVWSRRPVREVAAGTGATAVSVGPSSSTRVEIGDGSGTLAVIEG